MRLILSDAPLGPSAGVPDGSTCIFLSTLGTSNPIRGARLDRARSTAPKRKGTDLVGLYTTRPMIHLDLRGI